MEKRGLLPRSEITEEPEDIEAATGEVVSGEGQKATPEEVKIATRESSGDLGAVPDTNPQLPIEPAPHKAEVSNEAQLSPTDPSLSATELEGVIAQIIDRNAGDEHG